MSEECPDLTFFGRNLLKTINVAKDKFHDCPWPHFDGVPDAYPDRILVCDFSITHVMNSGISMQDAWAAIEKSNIKDDKGGDASDLLKLIPSDLRLEETSESYEKINWEVIDRLFRHLRIKNVGFSRIAKMLSRKRPFLIPMLDSWIYEFLDGIGKEWYLGRGNPPTWFNAEWLAWEIGKASPYIRMIRHDMIPQKEKLERLRKCLNSDALTEVPLEASLLRIYEATLWQALIKGLI